MTNNQVALMVWDLLRLKHKNLKGNDLMAAVILDLVQLKFVSDAVFSGVCKQAAIHIQIGNY